jgi:ferrous iron transport protein B
MLTAPLMACSARLPVYTLLISAFVPASFVLGLSLQGAVMFGLYVLGIVSAFAIAWVNKKWGRHESHLFLMELPTYKRPSARNVGLALWQRSGLFLRRAGTTIFGLSVLLWFLVSFPKGPDGKQSLEHSLAGRVGAVIAPVLEPVGFDWRISVALVPGLAAREVMVGALATVFAVEAADEEKQAESLATLLPKHFSLATALALLVWYVFAPQCLATFAVVRRESGSMKFAGLSVLLFFAMAYAGAFVTYQVTRMLG